MAKGRFKPQKVNPELKKVSDRLVQALVNNLNAKATADEVVVKNKGVAREGDLVPRTRQPRRSE